MVIDLQHVDHKVLLDAALAHRRRGWSVLPVKGKTPACRWKGFQTTIADERTLRKEFAKPSVTGLAVITGGVSGGLAVRDFDQADAYNAWATTNPDDANRLPTVQTKRGFHVYGRLEGDTYADFDDGELRGDSSHYILLPPSQHPDGGHYAWLTSLPDSGDLPLLPETLARGWGKTHQWQHKSIPHIAWFPPLNDSQIGEAINQTLPTGAGQRNRRIFDLARRVKGICPAAAQSQLKGIVKEWFGLALPFIRTKDFEVTWTDFKVAWDRIQKPACRSLAAACSAADASPMPVVAQRYSQHLQKLVGICWQLQMQWGDEPFPLGCETAGKILGISKTQAQRQLRALKSVGILELITKGTKASGKASECAL